MARIDREKLLEMAGGFRASCVLGAAAELDLFTRIGQRWVDAESLAAELPANPRALRILLDALAALHLLTKRASRYSVPASLRSWLSSEAPDSVLPMILHSINIHRHWTQLAAVTQEGGPAEPVASIRGADADRAAFIAAMHTVSVENADRVVAALQPQFTHLLDIGGASGTWTVAFLRAVSGTRATLFDLPDAIQQARARFSGTPWEERVELVAGDFYADEFPPGADLAWVSAIIHQHSRQHNRELFAKAYRALLPGGRIAIRDFVMDRSRTKPPLGAMFAVNMLVNTQTGDTFTFDEIAEDLASAGFVDHRLAVPSKDMNAVIEARKPPAAEQPGAQSQA